MARSARRAGGVLSSADLRARIATLEAELAEARAQQTATAEVLGVINASRGDLAPAFDAMLGKALTLCDATYGGLLTFDGDRFHNVAGRGHPEFFAWVRQQGPARPAPGTTLAQIVSGKDVVHVGNIANDDVYRVGVPARRALVDIGDRHGARGSGLDALARSGGPADGGHAPPRVEAARRDLVQGPMVRRLSAGGDWIRTSSTRAR